MIPFLLKKLTQIILKADKQSAGSQGGPRNSSHLCNVEIVSAVPAPDDTVQLHILTLHAVHSIQSPVFLCRFLLLADF